MESAYDAVVVAIPVAACGAVIAWVGYLIASVAGGRRALVEGVGWAASILTSLAALPFVAFLLGFLLFLPAMWFSRVASANVVAVIAWAQALILTVAVLAAGRGIFRRAGSARFLAAAVVILGLGTVWMGRYLATIDWAPTPS